MKDSTYHILLRVSALTLALLLLFDSGILSPVTRQLSQNTQDYVATAIGMHASVQPTELNQITAGLTERDRILTQRESDVAAREITLDRNGTSNSTSVYSTYIMSVLLFVLLLLIVLNYVLDFMRARRRVAQSNYEQMV